MVKAVIDIEEQEDRILTIVKGKYGLKNKNEAVNFIIKEFEKEILQANLKPMPKEKVKKRG